MIILRAADATESFLSHLAPIPIIGRVAGFARVSLGLIHTITALALTILFTLPALLLPPCRPVWTSSATHILHGLYDACAGSCQMVPILGMLF